LDDTLDLFRESKDEGIRKVVSILGPAVEKLSGAVSNYFPDLNWIRKDLIRSGYANEIKGGPGFTEAEIEAIMQ